MNTILPFIKFTNYLLFSILVGHAVLLFVPDLHKRTYKMPFNHVFLIGTDKEIPFKIQDILDDQLEIRQGK